MNIFSERIKELRLEKNLSQKELGEELNLSPTTITKWERGDRVPNIDIFIMLAKYFNCSIDYLVGLVD